MAAVSNSGFSDLFAGAVSVFDNPTHHCVVTFDGPVEAAETISLASVPMRILDHHGIT